MSGTTKPRWYRRSNDTWMLSARVPYEMATGRLKPYLEDTGVTITQAMVQALDAFLTERGYGPDYQRQDQLDVHQ